MTTTTKPDPRAERQRRAAESAAQAFARHVITPEGEGRWFCGAPGTGIYSFRVVTSPGAIFLHGDIGELVLLPHDRDSLAWLRRALGPSNDGYVDYPLSKIPVPFRQKDLVPEIAEEILRELAEEKPRQAERIRDALDADFGDARAFYDAYHAFADDHEVPSVEWWDHQTLFQLEALRWFVRNLPAKEAR